VTPLEEILPIETRREVWNDLRQQGLPLPALEFSGRDVRGNLWMVLAGTVSSALYLQRWSALILALPLMIVVYWINRGRAVHFPLGLTTVGEIVIYATDFREHKQSGYRWTHNEIALKVRMIVAESAGLPLEEVQPETRLLEL
jgi:hypothetical protein